MHHMAHRNRFRPQVACYGTRERVLAATTALEAAGFKVVTRPAEAAGEQGKAGEKSGKCKESKDNGRDLQENRKMVEIAKESRENQKRMEDIETERERIERA